ncbi:unnamed protein product [Sphagnum troendelagicum]|uniref:Uncharacterized protein n=1 Tax=Sphagnum troendelagicum TaxID=128251 RepID=A0ABP0UNY8_9BRYO
MANADLMIGGRLRCSYKRITFVLCAGNLVVALYMLQLVVGPLYFQTSTTTTTTTTNSSLHGPFQQQEEISKNEDLKWLQESNDLRRAVLPVRLMDRIKEIESETELEISKSQSASAARQKVALELAQQLQHLKLTNNKSNQRGWLGGTGLEEWRKRMLDGVEKQEHTKPKEEQANGAYL